MNAIHHSAGRREALQKQYDLLIEKITRLRKKVAIETDVAVHLKLEMEIEEAEADCAKVEQEIEALGRRAPRPHEVPLPPLLPYLSDRSVQESELGRALHYHQINKPRRPFICVIHGDEYECHDMFLERLRLISLPRLFKLDTEQVSIKEYLLQWLSTSFARQNRLEGLLGNLAFALVGNSAASLEEMVEVISRRQGPVMISTHLLSEDWQYSGPELAAGFIHFWNDWPDLAPGRFLVICLCLKYQRTERMGFLQKRKFRQLNGTSRVFFTNFDFSIYTRLHGATLSELRAIARKDVEDWAREHGRNFRPIDELLPQIRSLYEQPAIRTPEGCICMERLAEELKRLMSY